MLPWVTAACIITPIIGVAGMALNGELLYYLYRNRLDARLYHFACVISALNSFYFAFLVTIMVDVGAFVDGIFLGVMYGPVLFHLPAWISPDLFSAAFEAHVHTLWQATMVICMPDEDLRNDMATSASVLHETNHSEFHVFGARIFDEKRLSVLDIVMYDFIPSFTASYALFAVSAYQIRAKLRSIGGSISAKTEQMQRRFFRAQIAQVMLPLLLPSIPFGAVILGIIIGAKEMAAIALLFAVVMWPIPAYTALLLLSFVRKTTKATPRKKVHHESISFNIRAYSQVSYQNISIKSSTKR
ncbi:hypothetical protein PRIPAC_79805 [Pristionchus pacificus]|uniref:G protein-coupled receptor n=1 Tax=Pristionchus pacificus TaxID=54126 RepID=A0A2A6CN94_PRIPA|nr:hypothetical protein PRIPAC_79805 [Pristionchus pacificus]|eukprot:PDM79523.1 G protein-coupled receptor [Pristionchus pacificus]